MPGTRSLLACPRTLSLPLAFPSLSALQYRINLLSHSFTCPHGHSLLYLCVFWTCWDCDLLPAAVAPQPYFASMCSVLGMLWFAITILCYLPTITIAITFDSYQVCHGMGQTLHDLCLGFEFVAAGQDKDKKTRTKRKIPFTWTA